MSGVSARQGGHQVAQKLIQTGRPRKSLSWTSLPSRVRRLKSGAPRSWRGGGAGRRRASGTPAPAGAPPSSTLAIDMQRPEEQVAVVGEERRAEAQDEEGSAALA